MANGSLSNRNEFAHKNMFKLEKLTSQDPSQYMANRFTCASTVKDINETKGWFCMSCATRLSVVAKVAACQDQLRYAFGAVFTLFYSRNLVTLFGIIITPSNIFEVKTMCR